jgi:hypothetical protein
VEVGKDPSSPFAIADDLDPELKDTLARLIAELANVDDLKANGFCSGDCKLGDGAALLRLGLTADRRAGCRHVGSTAFHVAVRRRCF